MATTITFTRADLATMATMWEVDCLALTTLVNNQYPTYSTPWQYIFPHTSVASDGDVHIDMSVDSSGSGITASSIGASPLVCEVIDGTPAQLANLQAFMSARAIFKGIFRFYTEHSSNEKHFELHPVTEFQTWNGGAFVLNTDYRSTNCIYDVTGTTHATSTLQSVFNGSNVVSYTVSADNLSVAFSFPSPSVNYVQYDGTIASTLTSDSVSQYFTFTPDLVNTATAKCRVIANTSCATKAASLAVGNRKTVNGITRTDMLTVKTILDGVGANATGSFTRPIDLITFDVFNIGSPPSSYTYCKGGTFVGNTFFGFRNAGTFIR